MISATTTNVQRTRTPVRCRRCGQVLTAPQSVRDGIGPDCIEIERSGTVPAGREWRLHPGDWVTWGRAMTPYDRENHTPVIGTIAGPDPYMPNRFDVVMYDHAGDLVDRRVLHRNHLRFAGAEPPAWLTATWAQGAEAAS